jgi:predicted Zn-dependent protease
VVSRLEEVAERALEAAAPDTLVAVTRLRTRSLWRSERGTGAEYDDRLRVEIVTLRDGQAGTGRTSSAEPEALAITARHAAECAEALARIEPGDHPGLATPVAARPHEGFDLETARLDPEPGIAALAAAGSAPACWQARACEVALRSSTGISAAEAVTAVRFTVAPDHAFATAAAGSVAGLDPHAVVERATSAGAITAEPALLPAGDHAAVLSSEAVAALLDVLAKTVFSGASAAPLGARVCAPAINLSDSPRYSATIPRSYDAEGTPKSPMPLIQDGVAHRAVLDRRSAARAGGAIASTGHAVTPSGALPPSPRNLVLVGGGARDESELAEPVEQGAHVGRLEGLAITDPGSARFVARAGRGSYVLVDGRAAAPLTGAVIAGSALEILAGTEAIAARPQLIPRVQGDELYPSGTVCPALRVARLALLAPRS